eukprot:scaffold85390_cov28-Tisochrysis_lutea.AAC.1
MFLSCTAVLVTTIIYHGAHCIGHERWADRVMMKCAACPTLYTRPAMLLQSQKAGFTLICTHVRMYHAQIRLHRRSSIGFVANQDFSTGQHAPSILHMIGAIVHTAAASILAMGREGND